MKKRGKRNSMVLVSAKDWQSRHSLTYNARECATFYSAAATRIASVIYDRIKNESRMTRQAAINTALDLVDYLEDKVTGLNIWNAFLSLFREKTGRFFPFYDEVTAEDLYDDEPNYPEVRYLIWRGLNRSNPDSILNPINPFIAALSEEIFTMLLDDYETAPENDSLKAAITDADTYEDVMNIRDICGWLAVECYLLASPMRDKIIESNLEKFLSLTDPNAFPSQTGIMEYAAVCYYSFSAECGDLALLPSVWLARILDLSGDEKLQSYARKIETIKPYDLSVFSVESVDGRQFRAKVPTGEICNMSAEMLNDYSLEHLRPSAAIANAVFRYDGIYYLNGTAIFYESGDMFDDFSANLSKVKEDRDNTYKFMLEKNGGSLIGVARNFGEISSRFMLDQAKNKDFGGMEEHVRNAENILYFINSDGNITLLPGAAELVKLPDNPFYNKEAALKQSAALLFDQDLTKEMLQYIIEHNLTPDARLAGPLPDEVACQWFAAYGSFLATLVRNGFTQDNMF